MNGTEAINRDFSSLKRGTRLADKILIAADEPSNRSLPRHTLPDIPAVAGTAHGDMPVADLSEKRRTLYSLTRDEMQNCQ